MLTLFSSDQQDNPLPATEAVERNQWMIRSAAIIAMLVGMTVLNETNLMVPKQARMVIPMGTPVTRSAPVVSPASVVLQPAPQPQANIMQPRFLPAPGAPQAPHSAKPAGPEIPAVPSINSNLMLQMPGPPNPSDEQAVVAHPIVPLPVHPDVSGAAGPTASSASFKGAKSPRGPARKLTGPANIGGNLKSGALPMNDRKVTPASLTVQPGTLKSGNYGKVAPVAIPGSVGTGAKESNGKVSNVQIPGITPLAIKPKRTVAPATNKVGLLSKAPIQAGDDDN